MNNIYISHVSKYLDFLSKQSLETLAQMEVNPISSIMLVGYLNDSLLFFSPLFERDKTYRYCVATGTTTEVDLVEVMSNEMQRKADAGLLILNKDYGKHLESLENTYHHFMHGVPYNSNKDGYATAAHATTFSSNGSTKVVINHDAGKATTTGSPVQTNDSPVRVFFDPSVLKDYKVNFTGLRKFDPSILNVRVGFDLLLKGKVQEFKDRGFRYAFLNNPLALRYNLTIYGNECKLGGVVLSPQYCLPYSGMTYGTLHDLNIIAKFTRDKRRERTCAERDAVLMTMIRDFKPQSDYPELKHYNITINKALGLFAAGSYISVFDDCLHMNYRIVFWGYDAGAYVYSIGYEDITRIRWMSVMWPEPWNTDTIGRILRQLKHMGVKNNKEEKRTGGFFAV